MFDSVCYGYCDFSLILLGYVVSSVNISFRIISRRRRRTWRLSSSLRPVNLSFTTKFSNSLGYFTRCNLILPLLMSTWVFHFLTDDAEITQTVYMFPFSWNSDLLCFQTYLPAKRRRTHKILAHGGNHSGTIPNTRGWGGVSDTSTCFRCKHQAPGVWVACVNLTLLSNQTPSPRCWTRHSRETHE